MPAGFLLGLRMAPRVAQAVVVTVLCGYCLIAGIRVLSLSMGVPTSALSVTYMLALLALQLRYLGIGQAQLRSRRGYAVLAVQACLVYLPMLQFSQAWTGMPGFLAGSVLLVLPTALGWSAFGGIVASMAVIQSVVDPTLLNVAYTTVSTTTTGLTVYGLTRLATLITELHAAREELARLAVAEERLRFARDMHDLLGYSLSAITLKSELTHRLVPKHPERAQDELAEILQISRQALADVRSVASGYRELSFDDECRSVRSVLAAAEVEVHMDIAHRPLPVKISTVLATVLREGVTNLLRHSKAEHCEIVVRQTAEAVTIDIVNDGVPELTPDGQSRNGSGTQNLLLRVAALGGRLTARREDDNKFRLHASIPLRADELPGRGDEER